MHNTVRKSRSSGVGSGDLAGDGLLGFLSRSLDFSRVFLGGDRPGRPHRRSGDDWRRPPFGGDQRPGPKRGPYLPRSALRSPHFSFDRDLFVRSFLSLDRDLDDRFLEGDFFRVPPGDFERLFFDFLDLGDLDLLFLRFLPSSPTSFSFSFFSDFGAGEEALSGFGCGD